MSYFTPEHLQAFEALADAYDAALSAAQDALDCIPEDEIESAEAERARHVFNLLKSAEFAVGQVIEETAGA